MTDLVAFGVDLLAVAVLGVALTEVLLRRADIAAGLVLGVTVLSAPCWTRCRRWCHQAACGCRCTTSCSPSCWVRAPSGCSACGASPASNAAWSCWASCCCPWRGGVPAFGIEHSVAESRLHLPFVNAALYFATFPPSNALIDRIGKLWLAMSIPMMVLVCLRWWPSSEGSTRGAGGEVRGRRGRQGHRRSLHVLPRQRRGADGAVLATSRPAGARLTLLGSVLLLFVVLLNRRTVWLALIAGVAVVMLRERRLGPRDHAGGDRRPGHGGAVCRPPGGWAAGNRAGRAVGHWHRHLEWRIQGWSFLYASWSMDPVHWLVGQPFGSGFTRKVLGTEIGAEPHNFYFSTLLRMGLVGMLSLIALTGGLLRTLWRIPTRGDGLLDQGLFPALLTMQLIWCITWMPGLEQGIVTGLAVGLAAGGVRRGHLAFPMRADGRPEGPAAARPSRSPAGDGADPGGTSISAGERR